MKRVTPVLAFAVAAAAATLTQGDRDFAMSHLHASRKLFLDAVAGLSEAQWKFKPAPDRWSIAECAEHIVLTEDAIFQLVTEKILKSPPAAGLPRATRADDEELIRRLKDRSQRTQAPEFLRPSGRWPSRESLIEHFKQSRDRTIAFVESTQADLRAHVAPHPVREHMDAYQWLLLLAAHAERHTAQIEEIKADPKFPRH
ncbi:MAG: DinB family protein [Bryobacteraceae bacterium]|jgi:hypothetical protein|nr:DinB family protein [Bryobacteraceae bacterium]